MRSACRVNTIVHIGLVLEGGAEKLLTEMKDDELLKFVKLDIHRAEALG